MLKAFLPAGYVRKVAFASLLLMSFQVVSPFDDVVAALKKGKVETLSHYFDNMVEINLPSKTNSYSKSQAVVILKEFFAAHAVKDFKLIHKGSSGEGATFGIGNLMTSDGAYRITFFFREKGDKSVLQELRFEKGK